MIAYTKQKLKKKKIVLNLYDLEQNLIIYIIYNSHCDMYLLQRIHE